MSTSFASLVTSLSTIVKRPDLAADGTFDAHLKNAILKVHQSDYYILDLKEIPIAFPNAATIYTFEPQTLIPRFRTIKYINAQDAVTADFMYELAPIQLQNFLDSYGYIRDCVWYMAGAECKIRNTGQSKIYGLGVYLYPDVTLNSPSWIANQFPHAILYEAARTLFKLIGFDEQASAAERLLAESMALVKQTGLTTQGF